MTMRYHYRRGSASDVDRASLSAQSPRQWLTSGGLGTMGFGLPAGLARRWRTRTAKCCASPATAPDDEYSGDGDRQ